MLSHIEHYSIGHTIHKKSYVEYGPQIDPGASTLVRLIFVSKFYHKQIVIIKY